MTDYVYSSRGELLKVTLPDGRLIEYVHDPLGRRIAKKVNGVITEKYLWQGLTRLLAVYDGDSNLIMRFEYADARMPVAMTSGGTTYYLAYDQAGTLKAVADASGTVLLKRQYDSFGNILNEENSLPFEVPFGFAGGLYDKDTKLVRFGYRDYDPETGRWTAKDPILFAGGDTDLYGYCLNDPVNWVDPDGLAKLTITRPEQHPGGQKHIHWGTEKSGGRDGGAVNQNGTFRHGEKPPDKIYELIKKYYPDFLLHYPLIIICPECIKQELEKMTGKPCDKDA